MEVRYTKKSKPDGHDAYDVPLLDGGEVHVERGEWVDLPRDLVEGEGGLLAQGWESRAAQKAARTRARNAADDAAGEVEGAPDGADAVEAADGSEG